MALRISKEFKVGFYIVLAIFIIYWGMNYLKGNDVFARDKVFYAIYDNTEGLTPAKSVVINGYAIGLIDAIYFHPDMSGRLVVKMKQLKDYPVPRNSVAKIHSVGFLGEKNIQLLLGDSQELLQNGDTLKAGFEVSLTDEVSAQVAPIKAKAENLLLSLDTVVGLLSGFLTPTTQRNFEASFESLKKTFDNLESTSDMLSKYLNNNHANFDKITNNLESISSTLASNNDNITQVLKNVNAITDSIKRLEFSASIKKFNNAMDQLEEVITKVNTGQGTASQIINNPDLYTNLEDATYSLNRLLLDLKYNPNKYLNFSIFGNSRYYTEEEIIELEKELKKRRKAEAAEEKDRDSKKD
jgi:phospholipid/cholesterol/gamma-HCH transport system substrate-binding protein